MIIGASVAAAGRAVLRGETAVDRGAGLDPVRRGGIGGGGAGEATGLETCQEGASAEEVSERAIHAVSFIRDGL